MKEAKEGLWLFIDRNGTINSLSEVVDFHYEISNYMRGGGKLLDGVIGQHPLDADLQNQLEAIKAAALYVDNLAYEKMPERSYTEEGLQKSGELATHNLDWEFRKGKGEK